MKIRNNTSRNVSFNTPYVADGVGVSAKRVLFIAEAVLEVTDEEMAGIQGDVWEYLQTTGPDGNTLFSIEL